jgi:fructose-specific PTS system IIA-like component
MVIMLKSCGKICELGLSAVPSALSLIATDTLQGDCCRIRLDGPDQRKASIALSTLLKQLPDFTMEQEPASGSSMLFSPLTARLSAGYPYQCWNCHCACFTYARYQPHRITESRSSRNYESKDELQRLNAGMSGLCQKKSLYCRLHRVLSMT